MALGPGGVGRSVLRVWRAALLLPGLAAGLPCAADEFGTPAVTALAIDWRAAEIQLRTELGDRPEAAADVGSNRRPAWSAETSP